MPKAKLFLLACDDVPHVSSRSIVQALSDDHQVAAAAMECAVDWHELEMPVEYVTTQLLVPMLVGLLQRYPHAKKQVDNG